MQAGKEGKVVGVELRQYALNLSRAAIARVRKKKECGSLSHHFVPLAASMFVEVMKHHDLHAHISVRCA